MDEIGDANRARYQSGAEVERYLDEPYHALRIRLAAALLDEEVQRQFPETDRDQLKILELGAASAPAARILAERGYNVLVSDRDSSALPTLSECPQLQALVFDVRKPFPLDPASIHAIIAGELIEHLFDTAAFLSYCRAVLQSNGILVLTTPNLAGLQDRLQFLLGRSPRQIDPLHEYLWLHIRPFTASALRRALVQSGFTPRKLRSNYVVLRVGKHRVRFRTLARAFPSIGGSLILSAVANPDTCGV